MLSIDHNRCNGCSVCVQVCPRPVLEIVEKKAVIVDFTNCLECGACELNCSVNSITVTKGTGCLGAIVREDILKIAPKGTGCGCGEKGGSCC